jgi:hypothetical protein
MLSADSDISLVTGIGGLLLAAIAILIGFLSYKAMGPGSIPTSTTGLFQKSKIPS